MKAIRIHRYGPPGVLVLDEIPRPRPGPNELLVRVRAAGVNPLDWKIRAGKVVGYLDYSLPFTLGWDFSGIVEDLGPGPTEFKAGDSVFGLKELRSGGACASLVLANPLEVISKPPGLSYEQAAVVPLAALTAWQALFEAGTLEAGHCALIHAGAGGVGVFAIQMAKWKGARVIATSSGHNLDFLRDLGADEVIDYTTYRFEDCCRDLDLVLDSVGGETTERSWQTLRPGGAMISITTGFSSEDGQRQGVRARFVLVRPDPQQLTLIGSLLKSGRLQTVVENVYTMAEIKEAHLRIETGHVRGKLAVEIA
jgi:NADPH:quinone reductase-like Zn-dependent oxidoreductase